MSGAVAKPGTLVTPSLELERRIGAGGMGTVWIAQHKGLRKKVAVKLMAESILSSEAARTRFAEEAAAGANVKSRHVVQVFDTGASEELGPYIVMELLEGEDLGARLARENVMTPEAVARVVSETAHALDRAHAIGIVHRDIKPANLFLCVEEGAPFLTKVLDFGVATLRLDAPALTKTGSSVGTPSYMSPEQAAGSKDLDGRSDLYALGLVAFRALTGTVAFPRESIEALGLGVYNLPPPKPSERRSSLPTALDEWFARACARDRAARFPDGASMATELARALGIDVVKAESHTPSPHDDAPRTDAPTREHVASKPDPVVAATDSGLAQKTKPDADVPGETPPPPRNRFALIAAGVGVVAITGWALHVARDGASALRDAPSATATPASVPSTSASAADSSIPIGVLLDLSGERRNNGQKLLAATRAAEGLVNRSGGVRGRHIRLVVKDDQGDTGAFLAEAARGLVKEPGLKIIVGPMTSLQVQAVAPITQAAGVLEVTATATSPIFTTLQRPDERMLFRTVPSQALQAAALARVMRGVSIGPPRFRSADAPALPPVKPVRCATTAVIATDDISGKPFSEAFTKAFTAGGGRVVETRLVNGEDQLSYAKEIDAVTKARAECQVLALGPKAAARYLREATTERPDVKLPTTFAVNTLATSDFLAYARTDPRDESSPSVAEGVRGVRPPTNQTWRPEYLELEHLLSEGDAGKALSAAPFVANQFDAAILAALTLEAAGPDADGAALRSSIREVSRDGHVYGPHELPQLLAALRRKERTNYVGASGLLDLDENGDVESEFDAFIVTGGAIVDFGRVPRGG